MPNCCAPMSALWVERVRNTASIPAHLVGGSLSLHGRRIFGNDFEMTDNNNPFEIPRLDWDGHVWVVFGGVIGEISLFRTAYASSSPSWLRKRVFDSFGRNRGILLGEHHFLQNLGLDYQSKYVATDHQIAGLVNGSAQIIKFGKIPCDG